MIILYKIYKPRTCNLYIPDGDYDKEEYKVFQYNMKEFYLTQEEWDEYGDSKEIEIISEKYIDADYHSLGETDEAILMRINRIRFKVWQQERLGNHYSLGAFGKHKYYLKGDTETEYYQRRLDICEKIILGILHDYFAGGDGSTPPTIPKIYSDDKLKLYYSNKIRWCLSTINEIEGRLYGDNITISGDIKEAIGKLTFSKHEMKTGKVKIVDKMTFAEKLIIAW